MSAWSISNRLHSLSQKCLYRVLSLVFKPVPSMANNEESSARKKVGPYELLHTLGEGSFSKVKFGRNLDTGLEVAVKIVRQDRLTSEKSQAQLEREVRIMRGIKHPNICRLHHVMATVNNTYIVLEYVRGGELFRYVRSRGRLPEVEVRWIFQQTILGLHHLHRCGIAHRDLKLENVLLDDTNETNIIPPAPGFTPPAGCKIDLANCGSADLPSGLVVKITDFGLSHDQQSTASGRVAPDMMLQTMCGTPHYVAPEVLRGEGYNGFIADMWACGVMLYAMFAGYLPFDKAPEARNQVLFEKISKGEYYMSSKIPPSCATLIKGLLNSKPQARYTIQDIADDPWFSVGLAEESIEALHDTSNITSRGDTSARGKLDSSRAGGETTGNGSQPRGGRLPPMQDASAPPPADDPCFLVVQAPAAANTPRKEGPKGELGARLRRLSADVEGKQLPNPGPLPAFVGQPSPKVGVRPAGRLDPM